jgi:hypothetical protein
VAESLLQFLWKARRQGRLTRRSSTEAAPIGRSRSRQYASGHRRIASSSVVATWADVHGYRAGRLPSGPGERRRAATGMSRSRIAAGAGCRLSLLKTPYGVRKLGNRGRSERRPNLPRPRPRRVWSIRTGRRRHQTTPDGWFQTGAGSVRALPRVRVAVLTMISATLAVVGIAVARVAPVASLVLFVAIPLASYAIRPTR